MTFEGLAKAVLYTEKRKAKETNIRERLEKLIRYYLKKYKVSGAKEDISLGAVGHCNIYLRFPEHVHIWLGDLYKDSQN